MQAQAQQKKPPVVTSKSQNPPLTLITDKSKLTDDFRYFVKEDVVSDLDHLKKIIVTYEASLKAIKDARNTYPFWKHDSDLLVQLKEMTEDGYFDDLYTTVGAMASGSYNQEFQSGQSGQSGQPSTTDPNVRGLATFQPSDLPLLSTSSTSSEYPSVTDITISSTSSSDTPEFGGGNPFSTKAYNLSRVVPRVAGLATLPIPGASKLVAPLEILPKGIKELTKFKHKFMDYEGKIKQEYLKVLNPSKFKELFVYEILRWTQQNKRGTSDQLLELQIKVISYYYNRIQESNQSGSYTVDYTPSSDLSKIFGVDESIFTILQKIKQKDGSFTRNVPNMLQLDTNTNEFTFRQLTKQVITPEALSRLELDYKQALENYRNDRYYSSGARVDRTDLTNKQAAYNEAKITKE